MNTIYVLFQLSTTFPSESVFPRRISTKPTRTVAGEHATLNRSATTETLSSDCAKISGRWNPAATSTAWRNQRAFKSWPQRWTSEPAFNCAPQIQLFVPIDCGISSAMFSQIMMAIYPFQACDKMQSTYEYATRLCKRYQQKVRGLSGTGMQIAASVEDPDRSCRVACQDGFIRHRFYLVNGEQGHFPFGTRCNLDELNRFCVNGKCLVRRKPHLGRVPPTIHFHPNNFSDSVRTIRPSTSCTTAWHICERNEVSAEWGGTLSFTHRLTSPSESTRNIWTIWLRISILRKRRVNIKWIFCPLIKKINY